MPKLLKEPLMHFLALGLGLFALFAWVSKEDAGDDDRVIEVDRDALLTYIQYHARAFSPEAAVAHLDAMPEAELERLIDAHVREEALHREALALGMDASDHVIRHRLVQSIEFITDDLALRTVEVNAADVAAYYAAHEGRYFVDPTVTFTHVFFNNERHRADRTLVLAERKLAELNRDRVGFAAAPGHGDRFLYLTNYVDRDAGLVASHFGQAMAEAVFALDADGETWVGPLESRYGHHLVLLTARTEGRLPELAEIEQRVRADAERDAGLARRDEAIRALIDTYEVRRQTIRATPDPSA